VHIPNPAGLIRQARHAWQYFRNGVHVDGNAYLCDDDHSMVIDGNSRKVLQHVDVELRFWNRRSERITVIEIVEAKIPLFRVELTDSEWPKFEPITLEPGARPTEVSFVLRPKHDPKARVEASTGSWLDLEFRPSRGSERWARPKIRLTLTTR
jgi:hypothetical protein